MATFAGTLGCRCYLVFLFAGGAFTWWIGHLGPAPIGEGVTFSATVVDREDRLLRPFATSDGRWRLPARAEDVDRRYLDLLVAYEDKRFRDHWGVDPLATLRAAQQLVSERRIISGGSTLTMQVARLLEPRSERSLTAKLRQMVRAVQIERTLSKDEVLGLYLSLAPYGGNLEGVRAASLAYFGKEPRRLTLGEAALLVALPQSPEARRPDRHPAAARAARDRVLDRVAATGLRPDTDIANARNEPVPSARRPMPMLAPHSAEAVVAAHPGKNNYRLTLDAIWQKSLEELARERARALGPDISVAILAVDHATGDILAKVASSDYFDLRRAGQIDMTNAIRSPGSTLKPFIYGVGFEDGFIHPETLIDDRPVKYGDYAPENFDLTFQGTVTVRKALQLSLNVPAVAVLDRARRKSAGGAHPRCRRRSHPAERRSAGPGDGTRRRRHLAARPRYALRRHHSPWHHRAVAYRERRHRCNTAPADGAERGVACGAHNARHTAAGERCRWPHRIQDRHQLRLSRCLGRRLRRQAHHRCLVGRPDGGAVPGLVGRGAAAPILFDAFSRLGKPLAPLPAAPEATLIAATAKLPPPLQRYRGNRPAGPDPAAGPHPVSAQWREAGTLRQWRHRPARAENLRRRAALTVLMNGTPAINGTDKRTVFVSPDGPGFVRLTVVDAQGAADSVTVRVQ